MSKPMSIGIAQDPKHGDEFRLFPGNGMPWDQIEDSLSDADPSSWYIAGVRKWYIYPGMEGQFIKSVIDQGYGIDLVPC